MRRLSILVLVVGVTAAICAGCGRSPHSVSMRAQGDPTPRFEFTTYWVRAFGDPRPVDSYAYRDVAGAHPYVALGSVTNTGDATAHDVHVSVTWATKDGGVVARATATLLQPSSSADLDKGALTDRSGRLPRTAPPVTLEPGESADVLVVVERDATTATLDALTPSWHAVAS